MHRCLQIPELLSIIFENVHKDESCGPATVAALARTARCFEDAALNVLWSTQLTLVPLIKCFPSELLKETGGEDGLCTLVSHSFELS